MGKGSCTALSSLEGIGHQRSEPHASLLVSSILDGVSYLKKMMTVTIEACQTSAYFSNAS
eukprot:scaffold2482_cov116-Cylindrotheca_fusiformis.AAC.4